MYVKMALRWGVVSAGKISHDFVNAVGTLPKEDHVVVAVAARNLSSAKEFAARHGIPRAHEGYEALAKDPEIGRIGGHSSYTINILPLVDFRGGVHRCPESRALGTGPDDVGCR